VCSVVARSFGWWPRASFLTISQISAIMTYGSLGAAIALMIWMWMSIVFLFGAELNSEIEHQTIADSTTGPPKPLGDRGASTADTVGARYPS
jgi:membrane protein